MRALTVHLPVCGLKNREIVTAKILLSPGTGLATHVCVCVCVEERRCVLEGHV